MKDNSPALHPVLAAKPTIDFEPYRKGKWADPTLDLRGGVKLTNDKPQTDAWMNAGFDDKTWTNSVMTVMDFAGAKPGEPLWIRKSFNVPAEWAAEGGRIFLVNGAWGSKQYVGQARLSLNGKMVRRFHHGLGGKCDIDITNALRFGEVNEMVLPSHHEQNGADLSAKAFNWNIQLIRLDAYTK